MYVVIGHHGLDDQCITVRVMNVTCILFTEGDIVHLTSDLFGRPLVGRARGPNRPFPGLSEVAVLGSSRFPSEVRSTEDSSNLARSSCLVLVLAGLDAPVADLVLEVPLSDEFFNFILECDAFFCGVANISVISTILVLVSFRAVSSHCIWSLLNSCVLCGQEYILTRRYQVSEVIDLARRGSSDPLIWALGLLLVGVRRSSMISALMLLVVPVLLSRLELSCWCDLAWRLYRC